MASAMPDQLLTSQPQDTAACDWYQITLLGRKYHRHIKYSLIFLHPIRTVEAFKAVDWLADLPQRTWPQTGRSSDVILPPFC